MRKLRELIAFIIFWITLIPVVIINIYKQRREHWKLVESLAGCWTEEDINNMGWEDDGEGGLKRI
jgi:hypothetical protein